MATLSPNQVETIYRDENYEAFLTALPMQCKELEDQGFLDLFPDKEIDSYSTFRTQVYGSYNETSARNPGEALAPGTMGQGYNYFTALRAEYSEVRTIEAEYLESALKLGDYAAEQGVIQAENYAQAFATYWTDLFGFGAIVPATLAALSNGSAGQRPRCRMFAQYLKGVQGAVIAQIPVSDAADPDGKAWFAYAGNEHARSNGDTIASFAGKSLGYFNAGNRAGTNMPLTESNLSNVLLHMENDLPWGPDRIMRSTPSPDTLVVSGNLKVVANEIITLNEYRMNSNTNDKNTLFTQSKVFGIKNIIVDRFLPDNCWYVGAKGRGCKQVYKKGKPGPVGFDGPVRSSVANVFIDMNTQTWVRQFFAYWSHWFNEEMDMCWYAGSAPTTVSAGRPVAPTVASLANW